MQRFKKLGLCLTVGALSAGIAIAMPVRTETVLNFGQTEIKLTPVKNASIVLLGLTFTGSCLMAVRLLEILEQQAEAEKQDILLRLQAEQRRQQMASEAQLSAEQAFHQEVAARNVQKAFASVLQQEMPAQQQHVLPAQQPTPIQPANISADPPGFQVQEKLNTPQGANIAERLGLNPKCFMILGVPGSGKGMVVSNASRALKRERPHIKIIGVDPKADEKETGYWSEGFDHVFRKNAERMDDHDFLYWVKGCVEYFKKLPDGKLLIFDEITATFNRWSRLEKQSFESFMVDYCTSVSSSGDSRENYVWLVGQIPHASALGIDGGIRSIYKPVAIVSKFDKRATDTFLGTKFIPKVPGGNASVYEVMDKSPRGRAMYDYTEDRWVPMPELTNYSGYDRDSRTHNA